ncbi:MULTISPECIES: hypothetical protein [Halorubrum]|uniref:Uncharacterized protein n=1 Tax=Halorubrum sodomense TaxID=35743 RepID=A0A1I6GUB3_HALSD|nr:MULTISPECIES: hypothetical protein [Halorubrum]SFR45691.1 hypothetical protein SAMN04487937_2064 [Halorubrum sodomense]
MTDGAAADDETGGDSDGSGRDDEADGDAGGGSSHLDDVEDGAGCTEIWERLSERREE